MAIAVEQSPPIQTLADPRVKDKLQALRQTDNVTNIYYLARTYLYLALVIGGTFWLYDANVWAWWWNVPVTLLAIVLVGAGQHQLTGLSHEASHHILFKSRYWNDLISDWFCLYPLYSSTQHYRLQHLAHHQFVNDPDRDPDISQLQTSGHWLKFPLASGVFVKTLLKQLWVPNLIRYMRIRAKYNAIPTDKNPYLKKGWVPPKTTIRVGIAYMIVLIAVLTALVRLEAPLLLAIIPPLMWAAMMVFYAFLPENMFHQSRVHPVISMRAMTLMRVTYISLVFNGLAWLSLYVTPYATLYYFLLWLVPIFTSFSFFMILRQLVQHGNGDRGWLTNTRVFFVQPLINFAVFPMGQDYHLPHHLFASVPHYRLKDLHEALLACQEYRDQAVVVEGYFLPREKPPKHPTVLDVLGPAYHHRAREIYIDNDVLEGEKVEEKDDILRQGEDEKRKRREEVRSQWRPQ
ncbi:MAG: fatty acid desaturase [Planctomycetes bacterium]|nr:fatty acid desaturase [Planctomycetota bacterium]